MKKSVFLFLFIFSCLMGFSQQQKILFIGNSLTLFNNVPRMVREMSAMAGKDVFIDTRLRLGTSLDEHLELQETIDKVNEYQWDYVILQNSHYHIAFPEYHFYIDPFFEEFKQLILANNPDTKIIIFLDWAMKNGVNFDGTFYSFIDFQNRLINGTVVFADKYKFLISPIGSAWKDVVAERPAMELYAPDLGHPSYHGSYLEACVYYSTIFKETVLGNEYIGDLTSEEALFLQEKASNTVLNDLDYWNLTNNYTGIDTYNLSDHKITIYPNPVVSSLHINFEETLSNAKISLLDISSRVVFFSDEVINNNEIEINLDPYPANIYFVKIETSSGICIRKVIKK